MSYYPKVSLIMTVYNRDRYLQQAINSVLEQDYEDWELIIIDDGSTDGSLLIAEDFAWADSRIQFFSFEHIGRARSLEKAHEYAYGDFIGWIDSDDLLAPTALSETAMFLNSHPDVGMVYTNYRVIDETGCDRGSGSRCQIPYSQDGLLDSFMTFHFRLIRQTAFLASGGIDTSYHAATDYDLCLRLSEVCQIAHLSKDLYYYRVHPESISQGENHLQVAESQRAIAEAVRRRSKITPKNRGNWG